MRLALGAAIELDMHGEHFVHAQVSVRMYCFAGVQILLCIVRRIVVSCGRPPPMRRSFMVAARSQCCVKNAAGVLATTGPCVWYVRVHACLCLLYTSPSPRDRG